MRKVFNLLLFYCVCPIVCIKMEYVFGKLGIMTGFTGINNNLDFTF